MTNMNRSRLPRGVMSDSVEQPEVQHVVIDGERIRVALKPGNGTPLVICNNLSANFDILDDFVEVLSQPVLRFDLPGLGGSDDARVIRRMPAFARLLAQLLDTLDMDGDVVDLMGIGWGGLLAQQFARSERGRVRRLVLVSTSSGPLMFPGRLMSLWRLAQPAGLTRVAPDAPNARAIFGGRREDECQAISQAFSRARAPTRRGYAAQLYALAGFSSLGWLHRLTVPALVLTGDDDPIVPTVNARVLALLLPQARLEIIRGGGHWFALERPGEVARLLDDFLSATVAATPSQQDDSF